MNNLIQLDHGRYRSLFEHLVGGECTLEVLDQREGFLDQALINEAISEDSIDWDSLCYVTRKIPSLEDHFILATALFLGADYEPYWLKLTAENKQHKISSQLEKELKLMMVDIAHFLTDDYMNQNAIAGLSNELAVRYEEINMVYSLDDVWKNSHKFNEQTSYSKLLKMSLDYLSVDMIGLIIPGEEMCLYHARDDGIKDVEEVLEKLRSNSTLFFESAEKSLVVNRDSYSEDTHHEPTIPYKLIVSSISGNDHSIAGIVVFVNNIERPHYTNTDRHLCELLAREITKIFQSKRDPVTGLLNRKSFELRLNDKVKNDDGSFHSLIYFDIDRFQIVNDTWGHSEGDRLLQLVATLIRSKLGKRTIISRLGGDEFGVLLEDTSADVAEGIAEGLRRGVEEIYFISEGNVFDISCSFGVAEITPEMSGVIDVLSAADVACHLVKETGKNAVRVYQPSDLEMVEHHDQMYWASRIKTSLDEDLFEIFAQAITPISDPFEDHNHYEILVRLREENGDIVEPGRFIPAAERYNLMPLVDSWVLKETLRVLGQFEDTKNIKPIFVSINISGQSLCDADFLKYVIRTIAESKIEPSRICLEITETSAVGDLSTALKFIETLKEFGCKFSLDDFGSGMSSFGYLKHLPVDYLKIDGIFINNIINDSVDRMMVQSINHIAQEMGLETIAEFIENDETIKVVKELGIQYGQGYAIDKPSLFIEKLKRKSQLLIA